MMLEAATWDDWSTSETRVIGEDDKWHVALAPGEVKVMSLEQLDDLFRLSIVDAETKVWQNGMSEWQALGVIAGIDGPPKPQQTRPRPPPPRSAPPPPSPRPTPPSRAPVAAAVYAQPLVPTPFYAPPVVAPPIASVAPIASVPPLTVTQAPYMGRSGGGFGRLLFGVALLAGVSVTTYRNGLVREAAHAAHQDTQYARLEAALGGPPFGTLREVEQSTAAQSELPIAEPQPLAMAGQAAAPATNSESADATASAPAVPSAVHSAGKSPPVVSLESIAPEAKATTITKGVVAPAPAASPARQFRPAPVEKSPPVSRKPESQMNERERLDAAIGQSMQSGDKHSSKSTAKAKSNEYDPLNPSL